MSEESTLAADLQFRTYTLNFRTPIKMARGVITERRGVVVRLDSAGRQGFGELLPLEHFGTESFEVAVAFLQSLESVSFSTLGSVPAHLPATKFALEVALLDLEENSSQKFYRDVLPVSKLLPSNEKLFDVLKSGIRDGYSIFKMKIGLKEFSEELEEVKEVSRHLERGEQLRLDANEGLSIEQARAYLAELESLPVEFLEQPLKRAMVQETIELSEEFSTMISLDESIATTEDMIRCWKEGFRGVYASKPLRFGELRRFLDWREETRAKISYSTVFETAIGSVFAVKLAATDPVNKYGLGFGVSHLLENKELILPSEAAYRIQKINSFDRDFIWDRLQRH